MKTADISDDAFFGAVHEAMSRRGHSDATRWDIACVLAGFPDAVGTPFATSDEVEALVPQKIILSKARKLIKRNLLDGCYCGCRGEFTVL